MGVDLGRVGENPVQVEQDGIKIFPGYRMSLHRFQILLRMVVGFLTELGFCAAPYLRLTRVIENAAPNPAFLIHLLAFGDRNEPGSAAGQQSPSDPDSKQLFWVVVLMLKNVGNIFWTVDRNTAS
jgi:hypothetical protein